MREGLLAAAGAVVVAITLVAEPVASARPAPARAAAPAAAAVATDFAGELLALINGFRAENGLPPFVVAPPLVLLAQLHSEDMLAQGYFDHDSPDGTTFDQRVGGFLRGEGYKAWAAAENIDTGSGAPDPQVVFQDWLDSVDHRKNMLAKNTKQIGIGMATAPSAPGFFDGEVAPFTVTAIFGPPQPVLGESVLVTTVKGTVLVRKAGEKAFKPLKATELIKAGSEVESSAGRVRLTSAADDKGQVQTADFYQGRFRTGYANDFATVTPPQVVTNLALSGSLRGCGARKARALAVSSGKPKAKTPKRRRLWGSGKGHFRTTGRYASATVRGTTWLTQDSCTATLVRVRSGVLDVFDFRRHKHVLVKAGKSYTARKR